MIRPLFTEIALFLIPFVVYALFLVATRKGVLDPASWPAARLAGLVIVALILMIGSFAWFVSSDRAPPSSVYIPAHIDESGNFVPGQAVPRTQ